MIKYKQRVSHQTLAVRAQMDPSKGPAIQSTGAKGSSFLMAYPVSSGLLRRSVYRVLLCSRTVQTKTWASPRLRRISTRHMTCDTDLVSFGVSEIRSVVVLMVLEPQIRWPF
jgi:hypothetical protein